MSSFFFITMYAAPLARFFIHSLRSLACSLAVVVLLLRHLHSGGVPVISLCQFGRNIRQARKYSFLRPAAPSMRSYVVRFDLIPKSILRYRRGHEASSSLIYAGAQTIHYYVRRFTRSLARHSFRSLASLARLFSLGPIHCFLPDALPRRLGAGHVQARGLYSARAV